MGKRITVTEFAPSFWLLDRPKPRLVVFSDGGVELVTPGEKPIVLVEGQAKEEPRG